MSEAKNRLIYDILSSGQQEQLKEDVMRWGELVDVLNEIFWYQCRSDTGFWEQANIGIRRDWNGRKNRAEDAGLPGFFRAGT